MAEITERFKVRAQDGTTYDAMALQERVQNPSMDDPHGFYYDLKKLVLEDGRTLNLIDDETVEIVQTGERLTWVK